MQHDDSDWKFTPTYTQIHTPLISLGNLGSITVWHKSRTSLGQKENAQKNECIRIVRCPGESENCLSQKTGSLLLQMWDVPNMETNQRITVSTDSNKRQTRVRNQRLYDSMTVTSAMYFDSSSFYTSLDCLLTRKIKELASKA